MAPVSLESGEGEAPPPVIGIIYPPPEVRNIVDKTASFVARNGPEFEQRIKQNEVNNPKFNFLSPGDPYHAYYQHRVREIREGKDEPTPAPSKAPVTSGTTEAVKQRQSELLKQAQKDHFEAPPPKEPPAEFEFMSDPPSISALDLDIVRLTAMFVARNGRQFLTSLMNREQRNFQFDFLRPQHSLFQYFTKLLEQYTKVLIPAKDISKKLDDESKNERLIKDQIDYRVRWIRHQEAQKRREEEEAERERVSYAQIDWHAFVVVETVDYQPWEIGNFPPPTTPVEVGARVLMQRRADQSATSTTGSRSSGGTGKTRGEDTGGESNTQVEDMEESSSDEDDDDLDDDSVPSVTAVDSAPAVQQPQPAPPSLPTPGNVQVRKYDPKQARAAVSAPAVAAKDEYLVSPITGERIPASKVQEHMRIGLLDPRWVEERDKQLTMKATEDAVFAQGSAIESSLKQLAERRTDIFGVGEQETAIGKKIGEEDRREAQDKKVTWDGHSSSAEAATRAARANVSINDQIEQLQRTKGLLEQREAIGPSKTISQSVAIAAPPVPAPVVAPAIVPMVPVPRPPVVPQPTFYIPAPAPAFAMPPQDMMGGMPGLGLGPPMVDMSGLLGAGADLDEPAFKRMRAGGAPPTGEEFLIPEEQFLATNANPVSFNVVCPAIMDKSEWRLSGQVIPMTLPLQDTLTVVKARLHEATGMPPGKQKLQLDTLFLKDANTLAYYNVRHGATISLQIKERGGRKK